MVKFDPSITEIIFFDLEWYVPPDQRESKGASMIANPNKEGQMLLGGVFAKLFPLKEKINDIKYDHFWLWKENDEEDLVRKMYNYVKNEWRNFEGTHWSQADLILCGQGTSRFDVPVLYIKSFDYEVDSEDEIFYTFFKTKQVDLSNVAIPLIWADVMYPSNWNLISTRFKFKKLKESGASVWDMYDTRQYGEIEKRTEQEVRDCVNLYDMIIERFMTRRKFARRDAA